MMIETFHFFELKIGCKLYRKSDQIAIPSLKSIPSFCQTQHGFYVAQPYALTYYAEKVLKVGFIIGQKDFPSFYLFKIYDLSHVYYEPS